MLAVKWRRKARLDLIEILSYIDERNPAAADELEILFQEAAERLAAWPYMFRRGLVAGTREYLVTPSYLMIYRVSDCVEIIRLIHTSREYP